MGGGYVRRCGVGGMPHRRGGAGVTVREFEGIRKWGYRDRKGLGPESEARSNGGMGGGSTAISRSVAINGMQWWCG